VIGRGARRSDAGAGVLSAAFGMVVFLAFLFFALQVMFGLYARSVVRATLDDAAARAAHGATDPATLDRTAADARASLGAMGRRPTTVLTLAAADDDGDGTPDVVVGHAEAVPPRFVPRPLGGMIGFDRITASVQVRIERRR